MQSFVHESGTIEWSNGTGSDVSSGAVVDLGNRIGIAVGDIANGASGTVLVAGIVKLAKDASVIAQNDTLYWSGTQLTNTQAAGYDRMGPAARAAATGDSYAQVDLNAPQTVGSDTIDSGAGDAAGNLAAIVEIIAVLNEAGLTQMA